MRAQILTITQTKDFWSFDLHKFVTHTHKRTRPLIDMCRCWSLFLLLNEMKILGRRVTVNKLKKTRQGQASFWSLHKNKNFSVCHQFDKNKRENGEKFQSPTKQIKYIFTSPLRCLFFLFSCAYLYTQFSFSLVLSLSFFIILLQLKTIKLK